MSLSLSKLRWQRHERTVAKASGICVNCRKRKARPKQTKCSVCAPGRRGMAGVPRQKFCVVCALAFMPKYKKQQTCGVECRRRLQIRRAAKAAA